MANKPITQQIVKAIGDYLLQTVEGLQSPILEQFPSANEKLKYPSISVHATGPEITALKPWIFSEGEVVENQADGTFSKTVKYVTGELSWNLQLDLWCGSRAERNTFFDRLRNAFRSQFPVEGLSLELKGYHGVIARFDMRRARFDDTEATVQRREWRAIFDVEAHCYEILERVEHVIVTTELHSQVKETSLDE